VASAFDLHAPYGLGELLNGKELVEETLVKLSHIPGLTVLPAGNLGPEMARRVISSRMSQLLELLRKRFTYIIVDAPPLLAFAESRALAGMVDGLILVGRSGQTTREALAHGAEFLESAGATVLGVVLNSVDSRSEDYKYMSMSIP
jgi:capsular exopolysaccharide synthesis family protein